MIDSFQERSDLHVEAQLAFFSYFFAFLFPIPSRECILAEVIVLYQHELSGLFMQKVSANVSLQRLLHCINCMERN